MAIKAFRCNFFILVIFVTIFCLIALQSSVHPTPQQMRILFADFNASNADVGNSLKFHLLTDEIGYMTAYYDNRTHKVVLLGKAWIKPDKSGQPTIYCILHYENQHQPTVVRMEFFTTYIYYCALPSKEIPDAVALVFRSDSANSSIPVDLIRVRKLPIPGPKGKFAVCGPTLMRKYADWIKFVQWVEWYLLMGAERIFLYDYEATATVENLVNHYVNQNIIELMRWPQEKLCVDRDYFCQLARINDCVHRTRYRYKFVTIVDVDELIYPQFHTNLTAIFDHYRILSKIALPQDFHLNLDFSNRNLLYGTGYIVL